MTVTLYENMSDKRYVIKQLNQVLTVDVFFLEDNNVNNPYIIINMINNYNDINYCYIPDLGRYYYITAFQVLTADRLRINLKCDVLMSFADDIKTANALISRSNTVGNVLISDNAQPTRADDILTNLAFSNCEFLRGIGAANYSFLLNTFGGENSGNI